MTSSLPKRSKLSFKRAVLPKSSNAIVSAGNEIDPDSDDDDDSPDLSKERKQCGWFTVSGNQCSRLLSGGQQCCIQHQEMEKEGKINPGSGDPVTKRNPLNLPKDTTNEISKYLKANDLRRLGLVSRAGRRVENAVFTDCCKRTKNGMGCYEQLLTEQKTNLPSSCSDLCDRWFANTVVRLAKELEEKDFVRNEPRFSGNDGYHVASLSFPNQTENISSNYETLPVAATKIRKLNDRLYLSIYIEFSTPEINAGIISMQKYLDLPGAYFQPSMQTKEKRARERERAKKLKALARNSKVPQLESVVDSWIKAPVEEGKYGKVLGFLQKQIFLTQPTMWPSWPNNKMWLVTLRYDLPLDGKMLSAKVAKAHVAFISKTIRAAPHSFKWILLATDPPRTAFEVASCKTPQSDNTSKRLKQK